MKLIILDRDGVINEERSEYILHAGQWHPIISSMEAIARLNQGGWTVVVATNQSAIGRGWMTEEDLAEIHKKLHQCCQAYKATIDHIFHCPHEPAANCQCRKPKPGLLHNIAKTYGCNLKEICMVGDTENDVLAAEQAGCSPILVRSGKPIPTRLSYIPTYADLSAFVDVWLKP